MRTHPSTPGMLRRVTGKLVSLVYRRNGFNPLPIIAFDFAGLIIVGSILLSLPIASAGPEPVSWFDALFTSTSAVCVTGLVVVDTGTAYSTFGHVVLLILIQIGGLSFMAFATLFFWLMGKTLSLKDRMLMRDSFNEDVLGGVSRLVRWVILSTFFLELTGAVLFAIRFIPLYGPKRGVFYAIFHAVSAYCNAGFDLFGGGRSLTGFSGDALVNMTAISLIVLGGLGFGVLADIRDNRRFRRLKLHTKLVLSGYFSLMAVSFLLILALEWNNPATLGPMPVGEKLMNAFFQAVTLRTAGFNTYDQQTQRDCTKLICSFMMLIGAAPASTGGGIKVTTLAIVALTVRMVAHGESNIRVFERRIDTGVIQRALTIMMLAVALVFVDVCALSLLQPEAPFLDLLYECTSAMGTVGISAIGSASLVSLSRVLIIITMFAGRVGPLTLALLLAKKQSHAKELIRYPEEHIMIG